MSLLGSESEQYGQECRVLPICRSIRPVAFCINVVFPAPVTPTTAIKISGGTSISVMFGDGDK